MDQFAKYLLSPDQSEKESIISDQELKKQIHSNNVQEKQNDLLSVQGSTVNSFSKEDQEKNIISSENNTNLRPMFENEISALRQMAIDGLCSETSFIKQVAVMKSQFAEAIKSIASVSVLEESLTKAMENETKERIRANGLERKVTELDYENTSLKQQNKKLTELSISERSLLKEELDIQKITNHSTKKALENITLQLEKKVNQVSNLSTENRFLSYSLSQAQDALKASEEEKALLRAALESLEPTEYSRFISEDSKDDRLSRDNLPYRDSLHNSCDIPCQSKEKHSQQDSRSSTQTLEPQHRNNFDHSKVHHRKPSYADVVMENISLSAQLVAAQTECNRLQACLTSVASALEERAPKLAENEKAQKRLNRLASDFESLLESNQQLSAQLELIQSEKDLLKREEKSSKMLILDLKHQVCVLLAQIEGITPVSNTNTLLSGQMAQNDIISEHLVAFRNLSELHEKNAKLLESVRSLSAALEQASIENQALRDGLKRLQSSDSTVINDSGYNIFGPSQKINTNSMDMPKMISDKNHPIGQSVPTRDRYKKMDYSDQVFDNSNTDNKSNICSMETSNNRNENSVVGFKDEASEHSNSHNKADDNGDGANSKNEILSRSTFSDELRHILDDRISHLEASLLRRDGDVERLQEALQTALIHLDSLRAETAQAQRGMAAARAAQATAQGEVTSLTIELRTTQAILQTASSGNAEERLTLRSSFALLTDRLHSMEVSYSKEKEQLLSRIHSLEEMEKSLRTSLNDLERLSRISIRKNEEENALLVEQRDSARLELNSITSLLSNAQEELKSTTERLIESERRLDLLLKVVEMNMNNNSSPDHDSPLTVSDFGSCNQQVITSSSIPLIKVPSNLPPGQIAKKYLKMAEEAEELRESLEQIKKETSEIIENLNRDLSATKERLFSAELELNELKTEKEKKNSILKDLGDKLNAYMSMERISLEKELSLKSQIERVTNELDEVRKAHQLLIKTNASDLESLRNMNSKNSILEEEILNLKAQISTLSSNIKIITNERDVAEAASKALIAQHKRRIDLLATSKENGSSLSVLQAELELSELEKSALTLEAERLRISLQRIENTLATERAVFSETISSTPSAQLEAQLSAMSESNIRLREEVDLRNALLSTRNQERENLKEKLDQSILTISKLESQVKNLNDRIKSFVTTDQQNNIDSTKKIAELEETLRLKSNRIESILEKYRTLKQGFIDEKTILEQKLQELESHLSTVILEKKELEAKLETEKQALLLVTAQLKDAVKSKDIKQKVERKLKAKKIPENPLPKNSSSISETNDNNFFETDDSIVESTELTNAVLVPNFSNEVIDDQPEESDKNVEEVTEETLTIPRQQMSFEDEQALKKDISNGPFSLTSASDHGIQDHMKNAIYKDEPSSHHEELLIQASDKSMSKENALDISSSVESSSTKELKAVDEEKSNIPISPEAKEGDENNTFTIPFEFTEKYQTSHEKQYPTISPIENLSTPTIQKKENELEQREDELRQILLQRRLARQKATPPTSSTPVSPISDAQVDVETEIRRPIKRITPPEFSSSEPSKESPSGIVQSYINPYLKRQKNIGENFSQVGQDKKRNKKKN